MDDIEQSILNFKDEGNIDIKIRPSYYIHNAILMAQRSLMFSVVKTNIQDGIIAYGVFIEHIESLAKAAKFLDKSSDDESDYEKQIISFKDKKEYKEASALIQQGRLSNFKLLLLMENIFGRSPITNPLKDMGKKKIEDLRNDKHK